MPRLLPILPLVAALGLAGAAGAQETSTDTAAETPSQTQESDTAAEDAAAGAETDLDMGQPVEEDPNYVKETFGDWDLNCFRTEAEEDPCQMFQLLREEAGNPIAEFSIFRLPEGSQAVAAATIVAPLGTLLPEGIKISVDGGTAKGYAFRFCSLVGCYAQIGLTAEDIAAFKAGAAANVRIVPAQAPDQVVDIKVSLSGFTAAFDNTSILDQ